MTVDGVTHMMPSPFMVMATQNPIEYEGTFPLPEAQLDRFLIRVNLGYPSAQDEVKVLDEQQVAHPIDNLESVTDATEIRQIQRAVREVYIDPLIKQYIVGAGGSDAYARERVPGGEPTRFDRPLPNVTGPRPTGGTRLRHPRRREGTGLRNARAPPSS